MSWIRMSVHGGTHADAPLHYDPAGIGVDQFDLNTYIGAARVIDLRGCERLVTPDMVAPSLDGSVKRIILRTYERFPHRHWDESFAAIAHETIALMASRGVLLIGTDAPSIDPQNSKTLDAHHAVRQAGMAILEGLVLDDVEAGDYELIALPLKLAGLDASPVRTILRTIAAPADR